MAMQIAPRATQITGRVICASHGLAGREGEVSKEEKLLLLFDFFDFAVKYPRVQEYEGLAEQAERNLWTY
jgi:hypothetical protein